MNDKIGKSKSGKLVIVAGYGKLPFLATAGAKSAGVSVCVLGIRDQASEQLKEYADRFYWIPISRVGRWIKLAKKFGATELIFAGGVKKTQAFMPWRILKYLPDLRTLKIWFLRAKSDRRNLALLSALADEIEQEGIRVINSVQYCKETLADDGILTRIKPSRSVLDDIEFAWPIAIKIAEMDVGQAIAVREKDIIAVEAIEGTDEMIKRAGELAKGRWTLIKVAQPHQDMRFDVPTVGPDTIENLYANQAVALVIQAGKTIMIDKEKMIALADKYKIAIIGKTLE